ncbi:phage N-6-adenine-methyltransferase [Candidatus Parcubacteria bacterium]|nr:phage N-6-adenine-methyltransferase [Candidatus Parcubacteria bacterium]
MSISRELFSAASYLWPTPQKVFDGLHEEFGFTLDVCADATNTKCARFFQEEDEAMFSEWTGRIWCNPPYGRTIGKWIERGMMAVDQKAAELAVFLLPARTDTKWFHHLVLPHASEIRFVKGRLKFGAAKHNAPFPSMIVIFKP